MGKVVATVGIVVGAVALAATGIGAIAMPGLAGAMTIGGISTSSLLLAGTALQAVGRALTKTPKASGTTTERLNASLVTDTPRKMAFGRTALNTDLRYQEWWGREQEYCSQVFAVASHHCDAIEEIWLDDKLAWSVGTGVTSSFAGYLVVQANPRAAAGSTFYAGWSGRWSANAAFAGCATLYLQFKVTGNGKKGTSPFSSSITSRVTVVGRGALLPDPRFDPTVGGSGSVRVADQSTWAWAPEGHEVGRNPALALLFYLIGWRIQNPQTGEWKLAVGRGVPIDRIDLASFMTAANLCDEPVTRVSDASEPRYRCDGTFSEADDPSQVIAAFETCMNGKLRDSAGRFSLQVLHNDLGTPVVDFTDDDVLGDFTWTAGNDLNDRRNVVRGRYTDPAALYQLVDFPQVRLTPVDGIERIDSVDYALVQSPSQSQRLAKQRLQRQQYQGTFAAEFNARGWAVKDGDVVRLTFAALGFDKKRFRVSEGLVDPTGVVPLVLVEEHESIYAWDRDEAPAVQAGQPNRFDPLLLPIIAAIDDAGRTAEWPAIVGEGKPDDNATNSADPASPFGPGGTVGGTVERLGDFDKAIAAAKARQDVLENDTIPAINKAVDDAGERITATGKAADDAVAKANERIATVQDRAEDAYQQADKAISDADKVNRRVDSIVAEGGYDDSDVRAEIKRVDETAISREGSISRSVDTITASFQSAKGLTPNADFAAGDAGWAAAGFTFPSYGGGKVASSNAGVYCQLYGQAHTKVTDTSRGLRLHCVFRVFGVAQLTYVGFQMFDNTGAHIGNVYAAGFERVLAPGTYSVDQLYVGQWSETAVPQYQVGGAFIPGVNSVNPVFLANYPDLGGPFAGGYVQIESFWVEEVGTAQLADAKITRIGTTASDAKQAVADLRTDVDAGFRTATGQLDAKAGEITRAYAAADQALGDRSTTLEATASAARGTINPNPDFSAWTDPAAGPDLWSGWGSVTAGSWSRVVNPLNKGGYALDHTPADTNSGFVRGNVYTGNGWYVMEAWVWRTRGSWNGAGVTLNGQVSIDFMADEDSAKRTGDSNGDGGVRTWSKLFEVRDDFIGAGYKNFHLMTNWEGFGRGFTDKTLRWLRCSLRAATDAEVRAMKADMALNTPGSGVLARLTGHDSTFADLPNRYAAASRTAALESQVNFATDSGLQRTINARIEDRATTIANDKAGAVAEQVRGLTAAGGTIDQRVTASATDLTRGYTDADRALGSRSSVLEAAAASAGTSIVRNDTFNFWPDGQPNPSSWSTWVTEGNYRTERVAPGRGGGQYCVRTLNDVAGVTSGFFQTIYTAGAGKWVIEVTVDSDGSGLSGAGVALAGVWNIDFLSDPDVNGRVGDSQGEVRSWSKMVDLDGRDQIAVHAMHGWLGFGRAIVAKYMHWHRLRLRPATDGEIKAGKADTALNQPGGVLARLTSHDDAFADLPNRYAAASRTAALESQVNFATDSGLQRTINARIEDRATTIANGAAGAVAETVGVLHGEYNGTVGEVRDQRGVLNGLNGKTAAYVKIIADAGNGRAALSLWSDQYGGAWQLTGNGAIDGNLTINGTVTARAFNGPSMTREAASSWSGSVSPGPGQQLGVPWTLSLPAIPPQGRFIYEISYNVITNAGQKEYSVDGAGRPVTTEYVSDNGGFRLFAVDLQGNQYHPGAHASERVLATSDFAPIFAGTVTRGSRDETIDGGDYVRRYVAATFTLTEIRLKVTWVAI